MIYCDTSLLIAALTPEPHSADADRWLRANEASTLVVTPWVQVKFASAITMKVRNRALRDGYRSKVMAGWARLLQTTVRLDMIEARHFVIATDLAGRTDLGLRGGDALHLAIALDKEFAIATLDDRLRAAAAMVAVSAPAIRSA